MRNIRRRARTPLLAEEPACKRYGYSRVLVHASTRGLTGPSIVALAALIAFLLLGLLASEARAAETRTIVAAKDTRISEGSPTTNFGSASSLQVDGDTSGGRDDSAIVEWDLTGIASGTRVGPVRSPLPSPTPAPRHTGPTL